MFDVANTIDLKILNKRHALTLLHVSYLFMHYIIIITTTRCSSSWVDNSKSTNSYDNVSLCSTMDIGQTLIFLVSALLISDLAIAFTTHIGTCSSNIALQKNVVELHMSYGEKCTAYVCKTVSQLEYMHHSV